MANVASMHSVSSLLTHLALGVLITSSQAQYNTSYGVVQPVLSEDFGDPSIVEVNGNWFAFATSGNGHNVQVAVSPSFINHEWRLMNETDVLPDPGRWAINDQNIWAPDVIQMVDEFCGMVCRLKLTSMIGRWQMGHVLCCTCTERFLEALHWCRQVNQHCRALLSERRTSCMPSWGRRSDRPCRLS